MQPCFQACDGWRSGASIPPHWASMQDRKGKAASQGLQLKVLDGAGDLPHLLSHNLSQDEHYAAAIRIRDTSAMPFDCAAGIDAGLRYAASQRIKQPASRSPVPQRERSRHSRPRIQKQESLGSMFETTLATTVRAVAGKAEGGLTAVLMVVFGRPTQEFRNAPPLVDASSVRWRPPACSPFAHHA